MLEKIGIAVALTAALALAFWLHGNQRYAEGRADEKAAWVAAAEKEAARQGVVNADAQRLQRQALAILQKQDADLTALVEAQDAEADRDPAAHRPALGRDSVRRINAIH
jgi:hypothetical protein